MSEKNTNTKAKKPAKKFQKPNPYLYDLLVRLAGMIFKFKFNVKIDRSGLKDLKGPALIICPHISNIDFILVAMALMPFRPSFVVSEHFMAKPKIRWFLEKMAVIPKKMFCADVRTILTIMRAKEAGQLIVLFPEGRLTCFGHSLNLTEGTAELTKKLGIDVYTVTGDGAYKTLPKWSKSGTRSGRIEVKTAKLFDGAELKDMPIEEVNAKLEAAIYHDEDKLLEGVRFRGHDMALGLDGILYKCPECGAEFEMDTAGSKIVCRKCGYSAWLKHDYTFEAGPFKTINDWYFWQEDQIDLDTPLESHTIVAAPGPDGIMDKNAGHGHIYMDREKIEFKGEVFGQPLEFTLSTDSVKALPASVHSHFDVYYDKVMYNMHLQPDRRAAIKWVIYLDKLHGNIKRQ